MNKQSSKGKKFPMKISAQQQNATLFNGQTEYIKVISYQDISLVIRIAQRTKCLARRHSGLFSKGTIIMWEFKIIENKLKKMVCGNEIMQCF